MHMTTISRWPVRLRGKKGFNSNSFKMMKQELGSIQMKSDLDQEGWEMAGHFFTTVTLISKMAVKKLES